MPAREIQHSLPCDCAYTEGLVQVSPEGPWTLVSSQAENVLPCTVLEEGTSIRISPMDREYGGWDNVHFHSELRLPVGASVSQGILVTLEAVARECVTIALAPTSAFSIGKTIVVHFGASGNISTVIRRRLPSGSEAVDVTLPSRVCLEREWVSYWVANHAGHIYVGVGKTPGKQCIGCLDDSLYHQLRSPIDAVKYVGLSNSALGRNARPLKMRNVCVTTVPEYLPSMLEALPKDRLPFVSVESEQSAADTKKLLEEYKEECRKAKARAVKFGVPYKEPSHQAYLQWSQARRLRANPEKGFITGMDITSPEELRKQEARQARFGSVNKRDRDDADQEEEQSDMAVVKEPLPVTQAWDNEELTRPHRFDPPKSLWVKPPVTQDSTLEGSSEFSLQEATDPLPIEEKIHLFSNDWAAFKQIRTADVMAYFSGYGPSYVEWLGELSCNILFEDKFSASRALHHVSQEIPSPPPVMSEVAETGEEATETQEKLQPSDFGNMGWRFCLFPMTKIANDRFGRRGTTARVLLRVATSEDVLMERPTHWPKPPPGFTTKLVLGPGSDFEIAEPQRKRRKMKADSLVSVEAAMDSELQAGRDGFTVEEMKAERAAKRHLLDEASAERPGIGNIETREGIEE